MLFMYIPCFLGTGWIGISESRMYKPIWMIHQGQILENELKDIDIDSKEATLKTYYQAVVLTSILPKEAGLPLTHLTYPVEWPIPTCPEPVPFHRLSVENKRRVIREEGDGEKINRKRLSTEATAILQTWIRELKPYWDSSVVPDWKVGFSHFLRV